MDWAVSGTRFIRFIKRATNRSSIVELLDFSIFCLIATFDNLITEFDFEDVSAVCVWKWM